MASESPRAIAVRLRARQSELEEEILGGMPDAMRDPLSGKDADYVAAQRAAVASALDYALGALERDPGRSEAVPAAVVEQVQRAARHAVSFDTVLCFYVACRELLGDIVIAETEHLSNEGPRQVQATLGSLLQQLVPVIASVYQREVERLRTSPQQQRGARVRRLLNGERVDVAPLGYNFNAWHIAMIVTGGGAKDAMGRLEEALARQALAITQDEETVWGWIGSQRPLAVAEIERVVAGSTIADASFAIGEPEFGLKGWRVTHRQAQETRRVALEAPQAVTTYADVGLLAPWALDRAHALSFVQVHLGPLNGMRNGGAGAREALREIFKAGHQMQAAASALNVNRGTLRTLRARIESHLGFVLPTRQAELEVALRLEALYGVTPGVGEDGRQLDRSD
jgi:GGDEF-like domain